MRDVRVLIVDDEPDIRATVSAMLEIEGYDVSEAANGADALQVFEERAPDVILLDMRMPVMDGWQFAEAHRPYPGPHSPSSSCPPPIMRGPGTKRSGPTTSSPSRFTSATS